MTTVKQLMEVLSGMPADAEVACAWDGGARGAASYVWLSRAGVVIIGDGGEVIYSTNDRPAGAPTRDEDPYWHTPGPR